MPPPSTHPSTPPSPSPTPARSPSAPQETREQLLHLLAEASEFEHNLLCCYLYAAYSLKGPQAGDLSPHERDAVGRWRRTIIDVAIEEMNHLALVANLTAALGARPHFDRPNFPVPPGYHPAGIVVALAPFDAGTLDHFVFLERPHQLSLPDGDGFDPADVPPRGDRPGFGLMPGAVEYSTTAGFYQRIRDAMVGLAESLGERRLFIGDPSAQVGPDVLPLDGLLEVTDLRSALLAIDTIVVQGEGAAEAHASSHYTQFASIRDEFHRLSAARPGFAPAHPVARDPVMRVPLHPDRVHIDEPRAAAVLDVANALYNAMIRMLGQAWGRLGGSAAPRAQLLDAAIGLMRICGSVAEHLATLPANRASPDVHAGISFTVLRATATWQEGPAEFAMLRERMHELRAGLRAVAEREAPLRAAAESMDALTARFEAAG
jgi:hypothetical protein